MEGDPKFVSTPALAYLGDCVIELMVRSLLVEGGIQNSRKLNRKAMEYVTAPRQAEAADRIFSILNEEEAAVYRRGHNMDHVNVPKNATRSEYLKASGLEALFGYLYLLKDETRIRDLFRAAYPETEIETRGNENE